MRNDEQLNMKLNDIDSNLNTIAGYTAKLDKIESNFRDLANKLVRVEDKIESSNYQLREILEIMKKIRQRFLT